MVATSWDSSHLVCGYEWLDVNQSINSNTLHGIKSINNGTRGVLENRIMAWFPYNNQKMTSLNKG